MRGNREIGVTSAYDAADGYRHRHRNVPKWVSPSLQFRGLAMGIGSSDDDAVGGRSDNDNLLGESVEEQPVARQNAVHRRKPGKAVIGRIASRPCERYSSCSS
jgi:hypothetical protein